MRNIHIHFHDQTTTSGQRMQELYGQLQHTSDPEQQARIIRQITRTKSTRPEWSKDREWTHKGTRIVEEPHPQAGMLFKNTTTGKRYYSLPQAKEDIRDQFSPQERAARLNLRSTAQSMGERAAGVIGARSYANPTVHGYGDPHLAGMEAQGAAHFARKAYPGRFDRASDMTEEEWEQFRKGGTSPGQRAAMAGQMARRWGRDPSMAQGWATGAAHLARRARPGEFDQGDKLLPGHVAFTGKKKNFPMMAKYGVGGPMQHLMKFGRQFHESKDQGATIGSQLAAQKTPFGRRQAHLMGHYNVLRDQTGEQLESAVNAWRREQSLGGSPQTFAEYQRSH